MLGIDHTTRSVVVTDTEQRAQYQLPQGFAGERNARAEGAGDSNAAPDGNAETRPDPTDTPPVNDADNASGAAGAADPKRRKRKSDRETVATLNQQIAQLTARRDAAEAREKERQRNVRTRYMIILGARLDDRAKNSDANAVRLRAELLEKLDARDQAAVDAWRELGE